VERNEDLIKTVLHKIEQAPPKGLNQDELPFEKHEDGLVEEHLKLMFEEGLLKAHSGGWGAASQPDSLAGAELQMTWIGYDYLDHIRAGEELRHLSRYGKIIS